MLAVFAKREDGLRKRARITGEKGRIEPEDEEWIYETFDALEATLPMRNRCLLEEELWGGDAGVAYLASPDSSTASDGGISVFALGQLSRSKRSAEKMTDAHFILLWYKQLRVAMPHGAQGPDLLAKLGSLEGSFAFCLYDEESASIFVARDPLCEDRLVNLFWGSNEEGLYFSTEQAVLEKLCPKVTTFPKGSIFISDAGDIIGSVTAFSPLISSHGGGQKRPRSGRHHPKVASKTGASPHGLGPACWSESQSDLVALAEPLGMGARVPSQSQIAAQ